MDGRGYSDAGGESNGRFRSLMETFDGMDGEENVEHD